MVTVIGTIFSKYLINSSNITIKVNASDKVLGVYSNDGKLIEKSNEKISLTSNDYFLVVSDKLVVDNSDYIIMEKKL